MNISPAPLISPEVDLSRIFYLLANPARLQILLLLGEGDACVCHLKQALGQRQAYISQQLMILRRAGLVSTTRKGRHIYYRLAQPEVLAVVRAAASIRGVTINLPDIQPIPGCPFPADRA